MEIIEERSVNGSIYGAFSISEDTLKHLQEYSAHILCKNEDERQKLTSIIVAVFKKGPSHKLKLEDASQLSASVSDLKSYYVEFEQGRNRLKVHFEIEGSYAWYLIDSEGSKSGEQGLISIIKSLRSNRSFLYGKSRIHIFGTIASLFAISSLINLFDVLSDFVITKRQPYILQIFQIVLILAFFALKFSRLYLPNLELKFGLDISGQERRSRFWKLLAWTVMAFIAGASASAAWFNFFKPTT